MTHVVGHVNGEVQRTIAELVVAVSPKQAGRLGTRSGWRRNIVQEDYGNGKEEEKEVDR
jgi:hypothetical protein